MLPVKLPYYPKIQATAHRTTFGVMEISHPQIYDKPIQGHYILKVDLLRCLEDLLGTECFICREFLYSVVAGSDTLYNPVDVFASLYRRHPKVRAYVNDVYAYGNNAKPIMERAVEPLRQKVEEYSKRVMSVCENSGGKYLTTTHNYIYFSYNSPASVPEFAGGVLIC